MRPGAAPLLAVLLLAAPALGQPPEEGRWDILGEDGAVFVPARPVHGAYLPPADLGSYHNASEMVAAVAALAAARPDLVSARTVGTSVQGRPIVLATVSAPGDATGRVRVLFDGAHHGDEVIASEILLRFLQRIVAEYDANATMRALLDAVVIDVVPMVNPDGVARVPTCSYYADCRKNARGVDLNRNYPSHWGGIGSSGDPSSATYRGPSPASEPETRVIAGLLDAADHAVYSSLHSGAEMILWPWGWTTAAPPEQALYQELGGELSARTGAPHGQVSRILYGVSGDSMDQAYGAAAGWRALAISPETYEGSGNAFDWWFLFNPPESGIDATVARWSALLWHLVATAPLYAPARLHAPDEVVLGPDGGDVAVTVTTGARRTPGGSLLLSAPAALAVDAPNPIALAPVASQTVAFAATPVQGGAHAGSLVLTAGPAGVVRRDVAFRLSQVEVGLSLERDRLGSPETNAATWTLAPGPFDTVEGQVTLRVLPEGRVLASAPFAAPASGNVAFAVADLAYGTHEVELTATFAATDASGTRAGTVRATAAFFVERPQVALEKRFAAQTSLGQGVLITSVYRNVGTSEARDLVIRETVPPGYAYTTRDAPFPIPPDPLGRPPPQEIVPRADGGVDLVWRFGTVAPGALRFAQYRVLGLLPGEHALPSAWSYEGVFPTASIRYDEAAAPRHTVASPLP